MKNKIHIYFLFSLFLNFILIFIIFNQNYFSDFVEEKNKNNIYSKNNKEKRVFEKSSKNIDGIYKIKRVVDGDTVILAIKNKSQRVRLIGINTPESLAVNNRKVECYGKEAKKKAEELLNNKKVLFRVQKSNHYDKNGRLLGFIFLKSENSEEYNINFSELMIKEGFAYEYTYRGQKYKYQKEHKESEKYAKNHQKGLWGICK